MQEPINEWSDLLLKYLANNISDSELEELHRQIAASEWKKEQFLRVSDPDHFIQALKEHYAVDNKKGWDKLTEAIPALKEHAVIPFYKKPWVIIVAALTKAIPVFRKYAVILFYKKPWPTIFVVVSVTTLIIWVYSSNNKPVNYSYVETAGQKRVNIDTIQNGVMMDAGGTKYVKNYDTLEIKSENKEYVTIHTSPGKMWVLKYLDGSVSNLNASTTISFAGFSNKGKRHVEILAGEVDFDVVKNDMAPFIVRIKDMTIQTIGTKFNVSAYKDAPIKTTLIDGKIKVTVRKDTVLNTPGQQAQYSKNKFEVFPNANLAQVQAWTQHFFDFQDISVEQTMKEIGAWYGYEIIVKAKLSKVTYSSTIDRSMDMMNVFSALVPNLKITTTGKKVYITDPE